MKVLVANRGEIAVRIIRACRELGLATVAVYSDPDRSALHVRLADEAWPIGPGPALESYLRGDVLIDTARRTGAGLVHPGYGFLAEHAAFAADCAAAGLRFVGPSPDAIRVMGSKAAARAAAADAGVPVVPGSAVVFGPEAARDPAVAAEADRLGYPVLVKAVAGGGGKGMRLVTRHEELDGALRGAQSEAAAAFGDAAVYLERRLDRPRHIEVQLLADAHGTVVPFVERECSIQRRHQKVVEESPAAHLSEPLRRALADAAVRIARAVSYVSAGTIEFLVADDQFYFLEMNTRLQVEHPVTEAVTGVDLVHWQLRVALGERVTLDPARLLAPNGHAIECRIYAEDPDRGFLPAPGLVGPIQAASGPGVREDRGVAAGGEVPVFYDSLVSKLIVWAGTRDEAVRRLARALDEYRLAGLTTTVPFFQWLVRQPAFIAGDVDTTYLDRVLAERGDVSFQTLDEGTERDAAIVAALAAWLRAHASADVAGRTRSGWREAARRDALR